MTDETWLFERFVPGTPIGRHESELTQADIDAWCVLFPEDRMGTKMPPGMVASVTMQAYASLLRKKPPGNVHAGQNFTLHRLPSAGDRLVTELRCAGKEIKNERRWLTLETATRNAAGETMWTGRITAIWAA